MIRWVLSKNQMEKEREERERELKYQKAKRHAPGKPIEKLTGPWRKSTQLQGGKKLGK